MGKVTVAVVLCLILHHVTATQPSRLHGIPSESDEAKAVQRIFQLIQQLTDDETIDNPAVKLIRLSFHDCFEGCDGCLNLDNYGNNGLHEMYGTLNAIYDTEGYNQSMSRADFIALAGTVAVRQTSSLQSCQRLDLPPNCTITTPTITIKYGRVDCPTSPYTDVFHTFPNPLGDLDQVMSVFRDQMNMTTRQVVAITGVHTLGEAKIRNSGFRGAWVPGANNVFDNMFYRQLINPNWYQEEINDPKSPVYPKSRYQWTLDTPEGTSIMMLNTDVAIWKSVQLDDNGQEMVQSCRMRLGDCQPSITAGIVTEFANDNGAFHEAFSGAYQKLLENGYQSDSLSVAGKLTPVTTPTDDPKDGAPSTMMMTPAVILLVVIASMLF